MKIIRLSDGTVVSHAPSCAACFGTFDGVHVGHARLLSDAVRAAKESGGALVPAVWMLSGSGKKGLELTDETEKCSLFRAAGIEYVFLENFEDIRYLSPEEFVRDTVIGRLGCRIAVCGYNFRFGYQASGDRELLRDLMRKYGADAVTVAPIVRAGAAVSSTRIREALSNGDVHLAADLMGRPYSISGTVCHGKKLGRKLGFPTANIIPEAARAIPKRGVYLTRCTVDGRTYSAVTNIGKNPTVSEGVGIVCESFMLDFSEDIYGKELEVSFFVRLRDEKRFSSVDELAASVQGNIADCAEWDKKIKTAGGYGIFEFR